MLYGARQVGKTYILKQFGAREFDNMVYVNCYKNEAIRQLFSEDVNVNRLILGLSAISGQAIHEGRTDQAEKGLHGHRISMKGYRRQDWVTNIPLCAAFNFFERAKRDTALTDISGVTKDK